MRTASLSAERAALLIIDWQERLHPAMAEGAREFGLKQAETLLFLARELAMPVLVTEQYPRGLGHTVPSLQVVEPFEKTHFSALAEPGFEALLSGSGRDQLIVVGMEAHICVAQTVRDLLATGRQPFVVADACLSRRELDWRLGLERMTALGASLVTAEAVAFELLGRAGTPLFKAISQRIK
ncbi:isochorismatase family protein [Myxococcota bacterium]|nr:isochorismatase family protein [Myxococcota bacterium]